MYLTKVLINHNFFPNGSQCFYRISRCGNTSYIQGYDLLLNVTLSIIIIIKKKKPRPKLKKNMSKYTSQNFPNLLSSQIVQGNHHSSSTSMLMLMKCVMSIEVSVPGSSGAGGSSSGASMPLRARLPRPKLASDTAPPVKWSPLYTMASITEG